MPIPSDFTKFGKIPVVNQALETIFEKDKSDDYNAKTEIRDAAVLLGCTLVHKHQNFAGDTKVRLDGEEWRVGSLIRSLNLTTGYIKNDFVLPEHKSPPIRAAVTLWHGDGSPGDCSSAKINQYMVGGLNEVYTDTHVPDDIQMRTKVDGKAFSEWKKQLVKALDECRRINGWNDMTTTERLTVVLGDSGMPGVSRGCRHLNGLQTYRVMIEFKGQRPNIDVQNIKLQSDARKIRDEKLASLSDADKRMLVGGVDSKANRRYFASEKEYKDARAKEARPLIEQGLLMSINVEEAFCRLQQRQANGVAHSVPLLDAANHIGVVWQQLNMKPTLSPLVKKAYDESRLGFGTFYTEERCAWMLMNESINAIPVDELHGLSNTELKKLRFATIAQAAKTNALRNSQAQQILVEYALMYGIVTGKIEPWVHEITNFHGVLELIGNVTLQYCIGAILKALKDGRNAGDQVKNLPEGQYAVDHVTAEVFSKSGPLRYSAGILYMTVGLHLANSELWTVASHKISPRVLESLCLAQENYRINARFRAQGYVWTDQIRHGFDTDHKTATDTDHAAAQLLGGSPHSYGSTYHTVNWWLTVPRGYFEEMLFYGLKISYDPEEGVPLFPQELCGSSILRLPAPESADVDMVERLPGIPPASQYPYLHFPTHAVNRTAGEWGHFEPWTLPGGKKSFIKKRNKHYTHDKEERRIVFDMTEDELNGITPIYYDVPNPFENENFSFSGTNASSGDPSTRKRLSDECFYDDVSPQDSKQARRS